jgi:hypothetical protein
MQMTSQCSLEMEYQVVNLSKQDQRAMIQFLGGEGSQPAEIHRQIIAVCGAVCVPK